MENAYQKHLSSLRQIRMSEELVKWCEEKGIKEVSSEQIEIRRIDNFIYDGYDVITCVANEWEDFAFPVEVVDEVEEIGKGLLDMLQSGHSNPAVVSIFKHYLKSHYKLTRI